MKRRSFLRTAGGSLVTLAGLAGSTAGRQDSERLLWWYDMGDRVESSPTVVDGTVYVGSEDGHLYALDAGSVRVGWKTEVESTISTTPAVTADSVYLSGSNGLHALDRETGEPRWRTRSVRTFDSSVTVANGTMYVGGRYDELHAIDPSDGSELWSAPVADMVNASPTVVDGTVYVQAAGTVSAFAAASGTERWRFDVERTYYSSPTVVDGTLFVGATDSDTFDGGVYALDPDTGEQQWALETGNAVASSPTVREGTVYVGCHDSMLYALSADSGAIEWVFETGGAIFSSPTVAGETVFVGSRDYQVYAVDATTGELRWRYRTDNRVASSPTVVDGTLFVGSNDNRVYALDAGVEGSSEGSRVRLGTLGHHHSRVDGASGTVAIRQNVSLSISPSTHSCPPGGRTRVEVVAERGNRGVGSFELAIVASTDRPSDGDSAVEVSDVRAVPDGASANTEWRGAGGRIIVTVDGINVEEGPLLELDLAGLEPGRSSLRIVDATVHGRDGKRYDRVTRQDATVVCSDAALHWKRNLSGTAIRSSPTVVDGRLYVGDLAGTVFAVDPATGEEQWRVETEGMITSAVTVVDGTAYVGSDDVYALDAETGEQRWRTSLPGTTSQSPIEDGPSLRVVDGSVYVAGEGLHALDAETGEHEWTFETGDRIGSPPVLDETIAEGTTLIFCVPGTRSVYVVDAETGELRYGFERFVDNLVTEGGTIITADFRVTALGSTGDEQWSTSVQSIQSIARSPPTIEADTVLATTFEGHHFSGKLHALDRETGEKLWTENTGAAYGSPTTAGGTVYVGGTTVAAFDLETGEQRWQFRTERRPQSSPTVVDGTLFVADEDGNLYALSAGVEGSSDGLLAKRRLSGHHDGGSIDVVSRQAELLRDGDEQESDSEGESDRNGGGSNGEPTNDDTPEEDTSENDPDEGSETDREEPTPTVEREGSENREATTPSNAGRESATPTEEGTATEQAADAGEPEADDGSGPGFGVGGALAALGGAGYLANRNRTEDDEEGR